MGIPVNEIQPGESYLISSTIKYFLDHPDRIFKEKDTIRIFIAIQGNKEDIISLFAPMIKSACNITFLFSSP